ncbi:MAG: hypothetical protein PHY16_19885 [Methylobacter sp.]|nr:hypothetical protein [Methylobacter sp.]
MKALASNLLYSRFAYGLAGGFLAFHTMAGYPLNTSPEKPSTISMAPLKTAKERLSDKANDNQRIDNCKVAPNRRGPQTRAEDCKHDFVAGSKRAAFAGHGSQSADIRFSNTPHQEN